MVEYLASNVIMWLHVVAKIIVLKMLSRHRR